MTKTKDQSLDFGVNTGQISTRDLPADFTPSNYTPSQIATEGNDKTSAHLNGIDISLGGKQLALDYTPEDVGNKSTDNTLGGLDPSDTLYPSEKASKEYIDGKISGVGGGTASDTSTTTTSFNTALSSTDDDVQKALDTLNYKANLDLLTKVRSAIDADGIYTVVTYKRPDATKFMESTLSGGAAPEYSTRTTKFYAANGIDEIIAQRKVYTLSYTLGELISEVLN